MDTEPTPGTTALCSQCGKEIVFVGPYWDHPGEIKPKHPAIPVDEQVTLAATWKRDLDPREIAQINHAITYAAHYATAGAPGHGQFLLIAKLADKPDALERTRS